MRGRIADLRSYYESEHADSAGLYIRFGELLFIAEKYGKAIDEFTCIYGIPASKNADVNRASIRKLREWAELRDGVSDAKS